MTRLTHLILPASLLAMTTIPLAAQADPPALPVPDIAGTWEGEVSCTDIQPGYLELEGSWVKQKSKRQMTLDIQQSDQDLVISDTFSGAEYRGSLAGDPKRPDEKGVAAIYLDTPSDPAYGVVEDAVYVTVQVFDEKNNGQSGKLVGKSGPTVQEFDSAAALWISDCDWRLVRTATVDPI
jgi:hypothetical protein